MQRRLGPARRTVGSARLLGPLGGGAMQMLGQSCLRLGLGQAPRRALLHADRGSRLGGGPVPAWASPRIRAAVLHRLRHALYGRTPTAGVSCDAPPSFACALRERRRSSRSRRAPSLERPWL
eukprot:11313708-Alexandrium_andersonii.AAC.1